MDQAARPHPNWIARRSQCVAMSAIKEMSIRCAQVPGAISLAWGLPSFRTPAPIRAAVAEALEQDPKLGMYALPAGLPDLRAAAAREHERRTGLCPDPDRNVMVTSGNMEALQVLFQVILDPGDEVIVTDPGFVSHFAQIRFSGGVPVFWRMDEASGWQLDVDALPGLITPRTKAIVLVSPSNPTGAILSEDTLRAAAEIARRNGVLIVIDDPYSHFLHDNQDKFFNLASAPEFTDTIAYLFTFSKVYAMSGWRAGYAVVPETLREEMVKIHDLTMICTPRISQVAARVALDGDKAHLAEFNAILDRRRTLICDRLDRLADVFAYVRPQGAYYVFPRILAPHRDSTQFAHDLLTAAGVSTTPGSAFGPTGEHHLRMAFCVADDAINLAFDRMEAHFGT